MGCFYKLLMGPVLNSSELIAIEIIAKYSPARTK